MSSCNFTNQINGNDCIGDTRGLINQNFLNLDNAVCALSASTFLRNAVRGLEQTDFNEATLIPSLRTGYNFYPNVFNNSVNPYINRIIATYGASNSSATTFTSPVQTVSINPLQVDYPNFDLNLIDAVLIKIRVNGTLNRPNGGIKFSTRRNSSESWHEMFETLNTGPGPDYNVNLTTSEIFYFDKTAKSFDWFIHDPGTVAPTAPSTYNILLEILGYYYRIE